MIVQPLTGGSSKTQNNVSNGVVKPLTTGPTNNPGYVAPKTNITPIKQIQAPAQGFKIGDFIKGAENIVGGTVKAVENIFTPQPTVKPIQLPSGIKLNLVSPTKSNQLQVEGKPPSNPILNDFKPGQTQLTSKQMMQIKPPPIVNKTISPIDNFAQLLVHGSIQDIKDALQYTKETGLAWAQVPQAIFNAIQGKPIKPIKDLSPAAQRGSEVVGGLLAGGQVEAGAVPGNEGYILKQGINKLTKNTTETLGNESNFFISSKDLLSLGNKESNAVLDSLNLSKSEITTIRKMALNNEGVNIKIPSPTILTIADKPWWARIKDLISKEPASDSFIIEAKPSQATSVAGLLGNGEHTPEEVINTVIDNKLTNTPEGKQIMKTAVEAQKTGQNINIELPKPEANVVNPPLSQMTQEARNLGYDVKFIDKIPKDYAAKHFSDTKTIEVYTKGRTPQQINDAFTHEIGHVIDYQRRGIVADPMGDSIRGYNGQLQPMNDSNIYFRMGPKVEEAKAIRAEFPKSHSAATTQKEIYADAYKLYKQNPTRLNEIAPNIYKELDTYLQSRVSQPPLNDMAPKLQGLAKEAQKYKTPEEFINAQSPVYHGSPVPLKSFSNKKGGVFFTSSYENATGFAGTPDNTYEGYLNFKNPLVIDAKGAKWNELNTKYGTSTQEVIANAQKKGFDGVTFKNIVDNAMDTSGVGGEDTIHYAFKPRDAFLNESQLRDIWKKAQSSSPQVNPPLSDTGVKNVENPPTAPTEAKTGEPVVKSEVKPQEPVVKPTEVKVPREQLPVKSVGKEKVSRLEARVKGVLGNATEEQKTQLGLSTFNQMNNEEIIKRASDYVLKNPDEALSVLKGDTPPPKGLNSNSIFVAMANNPELNSSLALKLASLKSTEMGQNLEILKALNPNNPVKVASDIIKVREERISKRYAGKTAAEVKDNFVKKAQTKIQAPKLVDWGKIIKEVRC